MKKWDVSDKANWDYTGCVVERPSRGRCDCDTLGYVTGFKDMPHGRIWVGYVVGSQKEWSSDKIEGIYADSIEEYELFKQNKLFSGLGKELEDMFLDYFASVERMPILGRIKRRILNTQMGVEITRNARMKCESCGHYYHATNVLVFGISYWPPELHEKWHRASCPYCGEAKPERIWHSGYGRRIELKDLLEEGKK